MKPNSPADDLVRVSLLFFDGFQDAAVARKPEWSNTTASSGPSSTTGRDGSTNGAFLWTSDGFDLTLTLSPTAATCIAGVACFWNGTNTAHYILAFADSAGTNQLLLRINSSGQIELRRNSTGGTLLGTGPTVTANSWHHYGLKATLTTATTSTVSVYLDGALSFTVTGVATSSTTGNVNFIRLLSKAAGSGFALIFDDFYACDTVDATATQGRANNDFLGDLKVATMVPNGAGDLTNWTPSAGANYTDVDEIGPNTTDYVSSATTGTRDLYAMSDITGTVGQVYGVRTGYYVSKSDAGPAGVRPILKENGVITSESAMAPTFGSWVMGFGLLRLTRPSDGGVWMPADIAALQVGQEVQ